MEWCTLARVARFPSAGSSTLLVAPFLLSFVQQSHGSVAGLVSGLVSLELSSSAATRFSFTQPLSTIYRPRLHAIVSVSERGSTKQQVARACMCAYRMCCISQRIAERSVGKPQLLLRLRSIELDFDLQYLPNCQSPQPFVINVPRTKRGNGYDTTHHTPTGGSGKRSPARAMQHRPRWRSA